MTPQPRLVFVDTETNGLGKPSDIRIVTVTWLITHLDGFVEKLENHMARPDGFRIQPAATRIHGISEAYAHTHGQPIDGILRRFVGDLCSPGAKTILGHNAEFDLRVIAGELGRSSIGFDIRSLPFVCTMQSTASVCRIPRADGRGYKAPRLQELHLELFGCNFSDAHTSKADVEATAKCFFELRRRGMFKQVGDGAPTSGLQASGDSRRPHGRTGDAGIERMPKNASGEDFENPQRDAETVAGYRDEREISEFLRSILKEDAKPTTPPAAEERDNTAAETEDHPSQSAKGERRRPGYADLGMTTVIRCPKCSQQLRVPAGKLLDIRCKTCGQTFRRLTP